MRRSINITGNDQIFPYIIDYSKSNTKTDGIDIQWCIDKNVVRLFEGDVEYYRNNNEWYNIDSLTDMSSDYIPEYVNISKVRVYVPTHNICAYAKGFRYAVSFNTWINGIKIDLGTFMFKPIDVYAVTDGVIKNGNNEYHEYIDVNIIDPFYLLYSDDWIQFRNKICKEPLGLNTTSAALQVSLFVVDKYDNKYLLNSNWNGGVTAFDISDYDDFISLRLYENNDPFGLQFKLFMNSEYDWFLDYMKETYNITASHNDIEYSLIIKNKNNAIIGPTIGYSSTEYNGVVIQNIPVNLITNSGLNEFLGSWDMFEDGWSFVGSMSVVDKVIDSAGNEDKFELFTVVSNELPITQDVFSRFTNGGSQKILDIDKDMNVTTYKVVNKISNKIIQLERPNESKNNIIQPVFFKVKDLEKLTLHPEVTENISINLDDYKSKVEKFILQIGGCQFEQIGSNSYGILFKIPANILPASLINGTYYVLNENLELVTTGKYNCVR